MHLRPPSARGVTTEPILREIGAREARDVSLSRHSHSCLGTNAYAAPNRSWRAEAKELHFNYLRAPIDLAKEL